MNRIVLLTSFGVFGYGLLTKTVSCIVAGALGIGFVAAWSVFSEWLRSKRTLDEFVRQRGTGMIDGPFPASEIPDVFRNDFGKIRFSDASKMIRLNDTFRIFQNRYSLYFEYPKYRLAVAESASENSQHNLCFLLEVKSGNGYHRISQKIPLAKIMHRISTWTVVPELPYYQSNNQDIDSNWLIRSNDPIEADRIISSLHSFLNRLNSLFPKNSFAFIDGTPTNIDIHITDRYLLGRTEMKFAAVIEDLHSCFLEAQCALA